MELYELKKVNDNELVVKEAEGSIILVRNTTLLLHSEDGGTILVENKNNNTRITLCTDDDEAVEKVKANIPLVAALSGVTDENGHFYSDHSVVFDFERVKNIAFAIDEETIIQELMMLAEDNERLFMEQENINKLLDNIAVIAEVYSVAYIFKELRNFSLDEIRKLVDTDEPRAKFCSLLN